MINEDFMLKSDWAKKLYHEYAEKLPIIDYHCHLSPMEIARDKTFSNAAELFLGGDHYKWRQMRSCGVEERYITGDAPDRDKFFAYAKIMPLLIGNPLYHWTHLELRRVFGIDKCLSTETADEIWNTVNEKLTLPEFSAKGLIKSFNVRLLCTTDQPEDALNYHDELKNFDTRVLPAFRPDRAMSIEKSDFAAYMRENGVYSFDALCSWLGECMDRFGKMGCKISDHAFEEVPFKEGNAEAVFAKVMEGEKPSSDEAEIYKTELLKYLGSQYAARGWAMQLHMGALRNNNSRLFLAVGADTGFDSAADFGLAAKLSKLLDSMDRKDMLPKTVLYSLDPSKNYILGTMLGNFQQAPAAGKMQLGSAWWTNDHRDGIRAQLKCLANTGALGTFIGMVTDSRSFVSYTRHEYFRRILCDLIGGWVEDGEYPSDEKYLKQIIEGICLYNAEAYFGF